MIGLSVGSAERSCASNLSATVEPDGQELFFLRADRKLMVAVFSSALRARRPTRTHHGAQCWWALGYQPGVALENFRSSRQTRTWGTWLSSSVHFFSRARQSSITVMGI